MTIENDSLSYSGETLVYNNECELLWTYEHYPYETLFEDNGPYYSHALQTATYVPISTYFDERYAVISFNHSGKTSCKQNSLFIDLSPCQSWTLFNFSANSQYKPAREMGPIDQDLPNPKTWFTPGNTAVVSSYYTTTYGHRTEWWNDTRYSQGSRRRFKLIADCEACAASAYWVGNYVGSGTLNSLTGNTVEALGALRLYHSEDDSDKFRVDTIKVYQTDDFNIATALE